MAIAALVRLGKPELARDICNNEGLALSDFDPWSMLDDFDLDSIREAFDAPRKTCKGCVKLLADCGCSWGRAMKAPNEPSPST